MQRRKLSGNGEPFGEMSRHERHKCTSCPLTPGFLLRCLYSCGRHVVHLCSTAILVIFLRTLCLVALYYCFSIGITFYQKWFIKDFHFPLTVVLCHLIIKFILSALCRCIWELCRKQQRVLLSWSVYFQQLAITGVASSLDIGLSNWSFQFITISLYTMTKSTCIIFILGFALLLGLEKKRFSLIIVVLLIALGLFMFTYKSTQFHLVGFLLVFSASFLGGVRWTLSQLIMQKKDLGLGNPMDMIYHIQPWMIVGILPLVIIFEGIPVATSEKMFRYTNLDAVMVNVSYILFGSVLAFLMEISEYLLLTYTSSLTLSVAGIVKEVFTLYLAVHVNGDQMSTLNFIGLIICMIGITIHVILKIISTQVEEFGDKKSISQESCQHLLESEDEDDVLYDVNPTR